MRKVTTRIIAAEVGVSHATVSRVLNNDSRVHPETRNRVIEAARRLGYSLEPGSGRRTIAIIIYELYFLGYHQSVFAPLLQEIARCGYRAEVIFSSDIKLLETRAVAGAVSISLRDLLNEHWGELGGGLPLVRINQPGWHRENIYSVYSDGLSGMEQAVEYLHGKGHRKIAYLADVARETEQLQISRRYRGFCDAMARHGGEPSEEDSIFDVNKELPDFRRIVDRGVTAIIATGEQTGIRLMHELYRQKIGVPEELSLLAMEYPNISCDLIPPQTTLSQDFHGLAREAIRLLDRLIDREPTADDVRVPYRLIERESVRSLPPSPPPADRES